jgi:pteridine reductase
MKDYMKKKSLKGCWSLITGGSKRIGEDIARGLHQEGSNVIIHYMSSKKNADDLVGSLNSIRSESAICIQANLKNNKDIELLIEETISKTGRLDVLINNASSFYPTPLETINEEQWEDLISTNLKAPLFLSKAALPYLNENEGVIINIVDIHSNRPLKNHPIYGPAKAGLAMLTKSLAKDLAPKIRVNGVSPGAILWPQKDDLSEKIKDKIIKQTALRKAGKPSDITSAVIFLVKDSPYITGQIIAVDGGRSIGW